MKKVLLGVCMFLGLGSVSFGQDCCRPNPVPRRVIEFRCVNPCDVFCGVGCYVYGVGSTVVGGAQQIVTAPFRTRCCIPRPRRYVYVPGRLYRIYEHPAF